ncbi:hypothetical protein EXS71_00665 [Candidatus Uhrbacteria bacterium]|nr:hypothetical protein [Candidatus Uhrbacteria bacterium]
MDWKKKLGEIKPTLPLGKVPVTAEKKGSGAPQNTDKPAAPSEEKVLDPREITLQKIAKWDQDPDFQTLIRLRKIKKGSNAYYRLRECFYYAGETDITFDLNRWAGAEHLALGSEERAITEKLKKRGYESAAYIWWLSAQSEGMKYGTGTRELRLQKATEFAQKIGMSLEMILQRKGVR